MILETLRRLIAEEFGVTPEEVTLETAFTEDLGADSLDMVELMLALEEEFEIPPIDAESALAILTVGDAADWIAEQIAE